MRHADIARQWTRTKDGAVLHDAGGVLIAETFLDDDGYYCGYIHPREGRADIGVVAEKFSESEARRLVERELQSISSCAKERQLIQLRAAAPLRPISTPIADASGLALFDHSPQPALL